ncbi:fluoride efflux transporter CrcB [Nocardia crassostreae]|uniref:fluoride efflux transporter CrcB n=1 Tax=Nocardia crassostreae TaxID=53428 RepID=UPI00082F0B8B|nr:fluoride efflux transporter CrcB [Nocardia crassostreae]
MAAKTGSIDGRVLTAIALGGGLGAVLRYWVSLGVPEAAGIPWQTLAVNAIGCLAIGVLMVGITEFWSVHRLVRPFLGIGVLGGFTTFSTYAVEVRRLLESGRTVSAFGYLGGTVVVSLGAVVLGMGATRWAVRTARRLGAGDE